MHSSLVRYLAGAALVACATTREAGAQTFQGVGDLPGGSTSSAAFGVSGDGSTVVGWSSSANGMEAFAWNAGTMVPLGGLPGGAFESWASAANFDGSVLVGAARDASAHRAVRWDLGVITVLPQVAGFGGGAQANGISPDGSVLSGYDTDGQLSAYANVTGFRIDAGGLASLPDLAGGTVDSGAQGASGLAGALITGRVRTGPGAS